MVVSAQTSGVEEVRTSFMNGPYPNQTFRYTRLLCWSGWRVSEAYLCNIALLQVN